MHMYTFYVSQSVLFVSFDLARSKLWKRYLICDFRVSILETLKVLRIVDFRRVICIFIPEVSARNTIAHRGGVGDFSGLQNRKCLFIRKKIKYFHWSLVKRTDCARRNKAPEKSKSKPDQQSPRKIGNWPAKLRMTVLPKSSRSSFWNSKITRKK